VILMFQCKMVNIIHLDDFNSDTEKITSDTQSLTDEGGSF